MPGSKQPVAAIIGWPVSHSLSPRLHNYWLSEYGLPGEYERMPVEPAHLAQAIKELPGTGMRGVNLTIPHKEAVIPLLDEVDAVAKSIGAVNTIIIDRGRMRGTNTDAYGFLANIRPHLPASRKKAVVLGAGGAAKAVCHALLEAGFTEIQVTNRTFARAQELAAAFGKKLSAKEWDTRANLLEGADLLVNTTSLGMAGKEPLELALDALPRHALVTDIVYVPLVTPLLTQAEKRGNPIVDGLGMLLHQAVPAFEAWFGIRPEVTPQLRRHILEGRA